MPDRIVYSTGIQQQAASKYGGALPDFIGRHLWIFTGAWKVENPAASHQNFDMENLITVDGPGCFWCEQVWKPTIGAKCPGDPNGWTDPRLEAAR